MKQNGLYTLTYRLSVQGGAFSYVQLKAAMLNERDGRRMIIGINDIDVQVRQEEEYRKRLAQAQAQASIDALTGIRNKHAYLAAEEKLDQQIAEQADLAFAVSILDINDLKKINDTEGHQAGDEHIRKACRIICTIFKHSPVFRVGGDEFVVISQGGDLEHMDELLELVEQNNEEAFRSGGVVLACGTTRYIPGEDSCVASVFERADQLMYENKNRLKGKN